MRSGRWTGVFYLIWTTVFVFFTVTCVFEGFVYADKQGQSSASGRYRVETLRHISAAQGRKYLSAAEIDCTASSLPSPNTLLITAEPAEMVKASALLKLVDAEAEYVIRKLCAASQADKLPSNEQIAGQAGLAIGTFAELTSKTAKIRAIIDINKDFVVAIAPADSIEKITLAIEQLQKPQPAEPAQPSKPSEPNQAQTAQIEAEIEEETEENGLQADEFFNGLLNSLAEAEKQPAKPPQVPKEVKEPEIKAEQKHKDAAEQTPAEPVEEKLEPQVQKEVEVEGTPEAEVIEEIEPELLEEAEPAETVRSYEPEYTELADEELELDLPERLNIIDLLDLVGKYLDLDYLYDESELKDKYVALRVQGPIKVRELYPLAESVLKFRNFVMARKGNLVTIVPSDKVLEIDPVLVDDDGKIKYGDVIITRVFKLKNIDTTSAQNLLAGMKLGANVSPIPETGTLIVTGYTYRMKRIEQLLDMVDRPGEAREFRFRTLRYTMASNLVSQLQTMTEQIGTVSVTIAAEPKAKAKPLRRRRKPEPSPKPAPKAETPAVYLDADERTNRILMIGLVQQLDAVEELIDALDVEQQDLRDMRLYEIQYVGAEEILEKLTELGVVSGETKPAKGTAKPVRGKPEKGKAPAAETGQILVEEPQIIIVESTNSLLVNATAEQHIQIATIIGYVDSEPEAATIPYVVYALENQDPEELKVVLDALIQETVSEKVDKEGKIQKTTKKRKEDEDIIVVADPKSYSLIVYASKKNQQWISSLIRNLDEYRPQVLLDVSLVEITKNDQFKFDLDLVTKIPDLAGPGMDKLVPLLGTLVSDPNATGIPDRRIIEGASRAGGGGTGFYADRHIQALLEMMDKKGYGRVLARPKLLVNDNEEGIIKSEEKIYVVREETKNVPGDTPGTTKTETSVNFEDYIAGIQLTIQPHISKGDQLRLQIALNRTDFRPTGDTVVQDGETTRTIPTPPDTITSDVTTVVTVPDNSTIILGGLETIKQNKSGTKVPLLGDIPVIGGLFKNTNNIDEQSRLYVFVKAHILRPGERLTGQSDIEVVSRKNRAAFEEMEDKFQKLEDWPGFEPEPMDPVKILEED